MIFARVHLQPGSSDSFIGPSRRFLGFTNSILIDLNSANRTTKIFLIPPQISPASPEGITNPWSSEIIKTALKGRNGVLMNAKVERYVVVWPSAARRL